MHPLLERQLRRVGLAGPQAPPDAQQWGLGNSVL